MTSYSRRDEALRAGCAQAHEDDGINPKYDKQNDQTNNPSANRKLRQLCKQVAKVIELELAALPCAELFSGTTVLAVTPAPNASRLHVMVAVPNRAMHAEMELALPRYAGRLRAAVATTITRRRAPELVFVVVGERSSGDE